MGIVVRAFDDFCTDDDFLGTQMILMFGVGLANH
jgi:hypothetical protein